MFQTITWVRAAMLALLLASCGGEPATNDAGPASLRPDRDQLDEASARARKARVSNIAYTLDIDLTRGAEEFAGVAEISFELGDTNAPLDIDFGGGSVEALSVNDVESEVGYNGAFIRIPAAALKSGGNHVRIRYRHAYSRDGTGLHRFVDPTDGRTYLYTYLWPYYANRLFPSFDQPDLKATYEMRVRAPADWQVVSAMRESEILDDADARVWIFPRSEKFSTYIFSLHAGPYAVWQGDAGDIPIRLFARQSLADLVPADEWLRYTREGLAFYARYFDIPYPFHKYDQLIVPDFNIGAMENVAAITFAESYLSRGAVSRTFRGGRAGTVLHEMAHMWFGDLVTKAWWNDLWLNESFATYMSALAQTEATEFTDAWHSFFLNSKRSAFAADNLVTTHPIAVPVPSTDDFFTVFDSITYGKGASVLKQLSHFAGEEKFRLGVSNYLKAHAYGNTRLDDFIAAISEASGRDLVPWADVWLRRAGVNRIEAEFACADGRVTSLEIHQSAPENLPTLRPQILQVGLYGSDGDGAVHDIAVLPVEISGETTAVPAAAGLDCPAMVYPNHGDWAYAQVGLDDATLSALSTSLGAIDDALLRSMFWDALSTMVTREQLAPGAYFDLVLAHLPDESTDRVIGQVIGDVASILALLNRMSPEADAVRADYGGRIEGLLQDKYRDAETTVNNRNLLFDTYVAIARSDPAQTYLEALLSGQAAEEGIEIDQDRRWAIIQRLNALGRPDADALLRAEAEADPSDAGQRAAIAAEAAQPDAGVKRRWLSRLLDDQSPLPLARARAAIFAMFPSNQAAIQGELLEDVVDALPALSRTRDPYFLSSYAGALLAGACTPESTAVLANALEDAAALHPTALKFLREAHQQDSECVHFRQAFDN